MNVNQGQDCLQVSGYSRQGISNYVFVHVPVDLCVFGSYGSTITHLIVIVIVSSYCSFTSDTSHPLQFLFSFSSYPFIFTYVSFLSSSFIPSSLLLSWALFLSLLPQKCLSVPFGTKHKESKRFLAPFHPFFLSLYPAPSNSLPLSLPRSYIHLHFFQSMN